MMESIVIDPGATNTECIHAQRLEQEALKHKNEMHGIYLAAWYDSLACLSKSDKHVRIRFRKDHTREFCAMHHVHSFNFL